MGEQPNTVYNFGALGLDNIASLQPLPKNELEDFLGIDLTAPILLVTYHPLTLDANGASSVSNVLAALSLQKNINIVFTGANADSLGQEINDRIESFCASRREQAVQVPSLGVSRYLSLMTMSEAVIGNSSSGLLEAPYIGVPTVNIGDRQRGRLCGPAVVNCSNETEEIRGAIAKARSSELRKIAARRETPYGAPGASAKIIEVLRALDLKNILFKEFHKI